MDNEMENLEEQVKQDEAKRAEATVKLREVIGVFNKHFDAIREQLHSRSPLEQGIIGSFLVSTELEIKKDLKELQKE